MFQTKQTKIAAWLKTAAPSPFVSLLTDWHSGKMRERLGELGLTKLDFHIDWLTDYRCIGIQGRYRRLYVDIQIEPDAFTMAADPDEPDEPQSFTLESVDGFYRSIRSFLES